jgi:hypothetical protein
MSGKCLHYYPDYHLDILLNLVTSLTCDHHRLDKASSTTMAACRTVARSVLGRVVTIIWMGMPSTTMVVHALMRRHPHQLRMTMLGSLQLWAPWKQYSRPGTTLPQHNSSKSSMLQRSEGVLLLGTSHSPWLPSRRQMPTRMEKAQPAPRSRWSCPDRALLVWQKAAITEGSLLDPWCTRTSYSRLSCCMDHRGLRLLERCLPS